MRKILLFILVFTTSLLSATTYYVAVNGDDSNPGTITQPWATWQKGFSMIEAGDTLYLRGGVYLPSTPWYNGNNTIYIDPSQNIGHDGTYGNEIVVINYPGEIPILDGKNIVPTGNFNTAINIAYADFWVLKGFKIRNFYQYTANVSVCGINALACTNFHYENLSVDSCSGRGYASFTAKLDETHTFDTTVYINCDAKWLIDSLGESPGNMADGWKCDGENNKYYRWYGCRALRCSDDGFDVSGNALTIYDNCWAADCGSFQGGNGNGFKFGAIRDTISSVIRIVKNCLAINNYNFNHDGSGFSEIDYAINDSAYYRVNGRVYNCTAWKNDIGFQASHNETKAFRNTIYRNNISFDSRHVQDGVYYDVYIPSYSYPESNNTWDFYNYSWPPWFTYASEFSVTEADFLSTDSTELYTERNSDGSLPDINLLKLSSASELIDRGVQIPESDSSDVTLTYYGNAPDVGYSEFALTIINPYEGVDFTDTSYKANLHTHTSESDGQTAPFDVIKTMYAAHEYSILALTDHDSYPEVPPTDPNTTWPWTTWITEQPSVINYNSQQNQTSAFYPDLSTDGMFAIRGNELTACQEFGQVYTHLNEYFANIGWNNCPPGNFTTYLNYVRDSNALAVFNHPGRHTPGADWYLPFYQSYYDVLRLMEIFNYGDYQPVQNPRLIWDSLNMLMSPDSLIFGTSNPDYHHSNPYLNYNRIYSENLTEEAIRNSLLNGSFTCSYEPSGNGTALAPMLTNVDISGTNITLRALNCDSIVWFINTEERVLSDSVIDVADYLTANFVRAILYNQYGVTYTQPFGISDEAADTPEEPTPSTATDITAFTITNQTGSSTINSTNHTVTLTMPYGTDVTSLTPTITVSSGATINPLSGVARNFTSPVTYTVTAEDETTTQVWTVTVNVASLTSRTKVLRCGNQWVRTYSSRLVRIP